MRSPWSSAPLLMTLASLLFATMGVCVKLASARYGTGEIVFYRGLVGAVFIFGATRLHGGTLKTNVPAMHFWRSTSGVVSQCIWFYSIGLLPLATAVTLNYMSSVWMALFLIGGAVLLGGTSDRPNEPRSRIDGRLVATVLAGFAGVALVLRPTLGEHQAWAGLLGLMAGVLAAVAYLQVGSLGRVGEPEYRVVFYYSLGGMVVGAIGMVGTGLTLHHTAGGLALLLGTGVLATAAQILMTRAYSVGRTLTNASLQYLGIVFSFLYGVALFHDPVTLTAVSGMLLIVLAGIAATLLRAQAGPGASIPPAAEP